MQIDVRERDGVAILHPDSARIGASDAEAVGSTIREMFDEGRLAIAVDLRSVEFMDLSCLRTPVTEYKYLNRYHGLVCIFNVAPALHDFLQHLSGLFSNLGWFIGNDDYSQGLSVFDQDQ